MSTNRRNGRNKTYSETSGEYYMTKNGLVKRPHPPPTSVPMDDDFDALTQAGATTTLGPASVWANQVRASTARDPRDLEWRLEETEDNRQTWTDARFQDEEDDATARPYNDDDHNDRRYNDYPEDDEAWTVPVETDVMTIPGETDAGTRYDGEWGVRGRSSPIASESVDSRRERPLPPPPPRSVDTSSQSLSRTPKKSSHHSPTSSISQPKLARSPPHQTIRTAPSNSFSRKKGLEYELLDNRVVESTPERTVSISSWREDVIRKSRADVEMSVYYVSPDDYVSAAEKEDSGIGLMDKPPPPKSTAIEEPESVILSDKNDIPMSPTSPTRVKKKSTVRRVKSPSTSSSSPLSHPDKVIRSSTPTRERGHDADTTTSFFNPFHARQSGGSTISSIPPAPLSIACDSAVERILAKCRPSLTHLSIPLSELGIRTVEHLRAMARMGMSTKDKGKPSRVYDEVRREAYKRGITVVEWAILMEKGNEASA